MLVLAGLSDGIDGLLARQLNQRSSLGAYLDPIADKLLLSSSFVILAFKKEIAWWLTIIVLSRDVLILVVAVVIILIWGYRPFPPSLLGKMTTFFQIDHIFSNCFGVHRGSRRGISQSASRKHQASPDLPCCRARNGIGLPVLRQHRPQSEFAGAASELSLARYRIAIMQNHKCKAHDYGDCRQPA